MTLRRRAVLVVLCCTIIAELALIPLYRFFPENPVVQGAGVVLNLPGTLVSVVILVAGHDFLPADAKKMETVLLVSCGAVSVGFWTALTGFIFRKDRTEALAAWRQAVTLKPLAIVSLVIFLGTGIWFCVRMASESDATLSALLFVLASVFVWFTRRRPA